MYNVLNGVCLLYLKDVHVSPIAKIRSYVTRLFIASATYMMIDARSDLFIYPTQEDDKNGHKIAYMEESGCLRVITVN